MSQFKRNDGGVVGDLLRPVGEDELGSGPGAAIRLGGHLIPFVPLGFRGVIAVPAGNDHRDLAGHALRGALVDGSASDSQLMSCPGPAMKPSMEHVNPQATLPMSVPRVGGSLRCSMITCG